MTASVILTNLPKDATKALESVGDDVPAKGVFFFHIPLRLDNERGDVVLIPLPCLP